MPKATIGINTNNIAGCIPLKTPSKKIIIFIFTVINFVYSSALGVYTLLSPLTAFNISICPPKV